MRLIILLLVFLTGCMTTPSNVQDADGLVYNPKAAEINVQLGANYIANENYRAADEKLKRAFIQDPKSSKAYWVYAVLQDKLNQKVENFVQAQKKLSEFEVHSQHTGDSLLLAYQIESALGNQKQALIYSQQLVDQYPDSPQAAKLADSVDE